MYLEHRTERSDANETVDEHFGFSRYCRKNGPAQLQVLHELYSAMQKEYTYLDEILIANPEKLKWRRFKPEVVAISVPFPGNLYTSLRCGQWIRKNYPGCESGYGWRFANTELRSIARS
jgi:hypothetical protein